MQKTKIDWADYVFNPIKGLCPVACPYCYARKMYKRFKRPGKLTLDYKELHAPANYEGPGRIFVCSTMEIFHPDIPKFWRDEIFNIINALSSLTFIILTKMPERIDRPMPPNAWLGVTVEGPEQWHRAKNLAIYHEAAVKFISFEPILGSPEESDFPYVAGEFDWFIFGRLTGHGKKRDPSLPTLQRLVEIAREEFGRPIFMKSNLAGIWPGELIQEFPRPKRR